jgi:threonine/homoserine/homoserine lactone efflux protein
MTQTLMSRDKAEAKKKGLYAVSAWVGTAALFYFSHPIFGLLAVGGGLVLTYRWFMFRAKRGMRF